MLFYGSLVYTGIHAQPRLFYHTLCLIHVSKHFTNCALHELFLSCNSILGNTSVHRCSGPLKQQRLTLYMYMGELLLVGSLTVHLITAAARGGCA